MAKELQIVLAINGATTVKPHRVPHRPNRVMVSRIVKVLYSISIKAKRHLAIQNKHAVVFQTTECSSKLCAKHDPWDHLRTRHPEPIRVMLCARMKLQRTKNKVTSNKRRS